MPDFGSKLPGADSNQENPLAGLPTIDVKLNMPLTPECDAAQQALANMGRQMDQISHGTGWLAIGSFAATAVSGAGEGITFGADTPVTITFGTMSTYFTVASFISGADASILNAAASGNKTAIQQFNVGQLVSLASQLAATKIPFLAKWSDVISGVAGEAASLAQKAKEACSHQ